MNFNLLFTASCLKLSIKRTEWSTSRQVYLLWRWERHLAEFPHLRVVGRWPATPKRARYCAVIAFSYVADNLQRFAAMTMIRHHLPVELRPAED